MNTMRRLGSVVPIVGGIAGTGFLIAGMFYAFMGLRLLRAPRLSQQSFWALRFMRVELEEVFALGVLCLAAALLVHLRTGKGWPLWNAVFFGMPWLIFSQLRLSVHISDKMSVEDNRVALDSLTQAGALSFLFAAFP